MIEFLAPHLAPKQLPYSVWQLYSKGMAVVAGILALGAIAAPASAQHSITALIDACGETVASGTEAQIIAPVLEADAELGSTRRGVFDVPGGQVFLQTITSADTGKLVICMIEGAQYKDGVWQTGHAWSDHAIELEAHLEGIVPDSAIELTKTPDALEMHLYQRQFLDCETDTQWLLGPHYQSDGGFLFPVTIDWRLEGAVMAYSVMSPLFPATRDKMCAE